MEYKAPDVYEKSFNCPHCQAYSQQDWYLGGKKKYIEQGISGGCSPEDRIQLAYCIYCGDFSLWVDEQIIYPDIIGVPPPNKDLDDEIQNDYKEAASILSKSPRGAAALLRLAIQKLCRQLGETGGNINNDIANLVKKGLPERVQQALDIVRVVGNESVHPGEIDLNDNNEIAIRLFGLINIIADIMITQPKEIESLYNSLPEEKLDGINNRDSKT